jgi:hypothetical protein
MNEQTDAVRRGGAAPKPPGFIALWPKASGIESLSVLIKADVCNIKILCKLSAPLVDST